MYLKIEIPEQYQDFKYWEVDTYIVSNNFFEDFLQIFYGYKEELKKELKNVKSYRLPGGIKYDISEMYKHLVYWYDKIENKVVIGFKNDFWNDVAKKLEFGSEEEKPYYIISRINKKFI